MKEGFVDYVEDIIEALNDAESFVKNKEYNTFVKDRKTVYAVLRALEIIGEAVKHVPVPVKNRYPQIPWRDLAGMRDKVIHEYFGINLKRVWRTINEDVPKLKREFEKILKDSR